MANTAKRHSISIRARSSSRPKGLDTFNGVSLQTRQHVRHCKRYHVNCATCYCCYALNVWLLHNVFDELGLRII